MKHKVKRTALLLIALLILTMLLTCGCADSSNENSTMQYNSLEDFKDKNIGFIIGTWQDQLAIDVLGSINVLHFNTIPDIAMALKNEKIDALVLDLPVCILLESEYPDIVCYPELLAKDRTAYALQKDSPYTQEFSAIIDEFLQDGTIDALLDKWLYRSDGEPFIDYSKYDLSDRGNGVLRASFEPASVPYTYIGGDGAQFQGLEVELLYMIADRLDMGVEAKSMSFASVLASIETKVADVACSGISVTDERMEKMDFSTPHHHSGVSLMVRRENLPSAAGDSQTAAATGFLAGIAESFNKTFIREARWKLIVKGLMTTLEICFLSALFGTLLGFLICAALCSKKKLITDLAKVFCCILSRMPSVLLLLISNFVIFRTADVSPIFVSIASFSVIFSASVGELLATGIDSVDNGQQEAAEALGFSKLQAFRKVIAPQVIRSSMPHYKGALVSLLMLTAIVGYISIVDLTMAGDVIRGRTYEAFFPLITIALIYFVFSTLIIVLIDKLQIKIFARKQKLKGIVPVERVEDTLKNNKLIESSPDEVIVSIKNLRKTFDGAGTPLKDVSACVRRGEVITIIGPSGTGKSTFLRCINHIETPSEGKIEVFGQDMCSKSTNLTLIRRRMGMVFQSFNLFPHMTVVENVMLAPVEILKQSRQEAYENALKLLKSVGVAEKAMSYPDDLSGGQKQRVAIARTLAMSPELILFDEPTSALDPSSVGEVLTVLRKLASEGYTMMIVTHEMRFARKVSSRIFYMDDGIVYEDGTPEQIFDSPKKNKTRAFVRGLQVLSFKIDSPEYDFIALTERLKYFGERNRLDNDDIDKLYRAFDEICTIGIVPQKYGDSSLVVVTEHSEETHETVMKFFWGGEAKNPLDTADELSVTLLRSYLKDISYKYENSKNILTASI